MKNHSFRVELLIFSSILLLFILPPFFTPLLNERDNLFGNWTFPFQQIIYGFIALFIFFSLKEKGQKILFLRFPVLLTVGLLLCSSLIMKAISAFTGNENNISSIAIPKSFLQWVYCLFTFFPSALYEEVIYRFYFPDALKSIISRKNNKKIVMILCEIFSCLIFAFAHYYLGWLSIINAVFGHLILRVCYKKNATIWPGVIAHFIYNVISLILL